MARLATGRGHYAAGARPAAALLFAAGEISHAGPPFLEVFNLPLNALAALAEIVDYGIAAIGQSAARCTAQVMVMSTALGTINVYDHAACSVSVSGLLTKAPSQRYGMVME